MARTVPDAEWVPELERLGVTVSDPTTFHDTLGAIIDPAVIRTVVRLALAEKVPASFDRPVGLLTQTDAVWGQALDAELDQDRIDFWSWVLKVKPAR